MVTAAAVDAPTQTVSVETSLASLATVVVVAADLSTQTASVEMLHSS